MATQTKVDGQDLIAERDNCLPDLISSLQHEKQTRKQLENINNCVKYLRTFHIYEVNSGVLQWVMPVVGTCLTKIYQDNLLLISTADDDFISDMVKENLTIAVGYIEVVRIVLHYIAAKGTVSIEMVESLPITTGRLLLRTFEYCKNSSETSKNTFKEELLELFRISQEVHTLYLQLFESYIQFDKMHNGSELDVLREVLDIICELSGILSDMNVKSMISNWKGYMGLAKKHAPILENCIDLVPPIKNLMAEIMRNLSTLSNQAITNQNFNSTTSRVINICNFLIKVTVKLFEIYGKALEKVPEEFLIFCCSVYSFPPELFHSQEFPPNVVESIIHTIFIPFESFICHVLSEEIIRKMIELDNIPFDNISYGFLKFLSIVLKNIVNQVNNFQNIKLDTFLTLIFDCIRSCHFEHYWSSPHVNNLFDDLTVNISATIIINPHYFSEVEKILLQNILQEHTFSALLAIEIWDLLLSNSSPQFRMNTLTILIDKLESLQFGVNTFRLERAHLKHLILRISRNVSFMDRIAIINKYQSKTGLWKTEGILGTLTQQQQQVVENLCQLTTEKVSNLSQKGFSSSDLVSIGENFDTLSKVKFVDLHIDSSSLVNAVASIWELNHNSVSNNVFKYFAIKLCKITRALILEFTATQLFMIFNQLKILSSDVSYKFQICNILLAFSEKNSNHLGQDASRIFSVVLNIIHTNIITAPEAIIRQYAFEIIDNFRKNSRHDIVRDIMKAKETQGELANYLQKNTNKETFDKEYFMWLNNLKYRHVCVNWMVDIAQPAKKIKVIHEPDKFCKNVLPRRSNDPPPSSGENQMDQEKADDIAEAIANIRSDVKYLMNLLKSQKLTQKNVSDLKLLTNQLLSLM